MSDPKLNPMFRANTEELYISISVLSQQIRSTLEIEFSHIRVKGEVVQPKQYQSGLYFTLKEGLYSLDCVAWKDVKLDPIPTEGAELICSGRLTAYSGRSKYQLNVTKVEAFGIGVLLKAIEERRNRLLKEGLFDPAKKPPVPKLPKRIGLLTSKTGAVLHDMLHRLRDRYPVRVTLYPIQVQGIESPSQAIAGIRYLEPLVDLIILARGGGSFEDLVGFNDEALVRAVAGSRTPVVTGIGHETDTTLVDYAASLRAPTPTAAIELATPRLSDLVKKLADLEKQVQFGMRSKLENGFLQLSRCDLDKESFMRFLTQKLEYVAHDLRNTKNQFLKIKEQRIKTTPIYLKSRLENLHMLLQKTWDKKHKVVKEFLFKRQLEIEKLQAINTPNNYMITDGVRPILTRKGAIEARILSLNFPDGMVKAKVIEE